MNKILLENGFFSDDGSSAEKCFGAHFHKYDRGEMIFGHLRDTRKTAIVLEGTVLLINVNSEGQKSILDICREGDAFGGVFFPYQWSSACYAIAKTKCVVSYVEHSRLIRCCENRCEKHAELIDLLLGSAARRSMAHTDILSRRSIREKLLNAFEYFLEGKHKEEHRLPISLSELADYLGCDRSAMMREIKRLNDDGLIHSSGNKIALLTEKNDI